MSNKELTHRVYYTEEGYPTFFEKQGDVYWCTHGNWEATPVGNNLQFDDGDLLPYVKFKDLTKEEHNEMRLNYVF